MAPFPPSKDKGTPSSHHDAEPSTSSSVSLGDEIYNASIEIHGQLQRMVNARLPLALPGNTNTPSIYISGLVHIAPVYITLSACGRDS